MNVKRIVGKKAESGIVTCGFRPFVAMITTIIIPIVNISEKIIPASVAVVPIASAIEVR